MLPVNIQASQTSLICQTFIRECGFFQACGLYQVPYIQNVIGTELSENSTGKIVFN